MSHDISDTFAHQLQQRRSDLIAQLREQRGGKIGRAQAASDPHDEQSGDWYQLEAQRDLAMALDDHEVAQLVAIDTALKRIATGEYGLCTDCGAEIPTARLHANPAAMRCVGCQDKAEHSKGQPARPTM